MEKAKPIRAAGQTLKQIEKKRCAFVCDGTNAHAALDCCCRLGARRLLFVFLLFFFELAALAPSGLGAALACEQDERGRRMSPQASMKEGRKRKM